LRRADLPRAASVGFGVQREARPGQTLGDRGLEVDLLTMFNRQAAHMVDQLGAPSLSDKQKRDFAHTLCGSARAVGATRVADAARAFEDAVAGDPVGVDAALTRLRDATSDARAAIADLLADG
jgi:HPt (histidine-containing phosphotransfer) domain-containing protein